MQDSLVSAVAIALALAVLDGLWLGVLAGPAYRRHLGERLAKRVSWPAAIGFYGLLVAGLAGFAALPANGAAEALLRGAGVGALAYGAWNLTNLAVLTDWPRRLWLMDLPWGIALCALAGLAGHLAIAG